MRRIAHHGHGQKPERMKFLRIIFACPKGAGKWRILFFAMLLHRKTDVGKPTSVFMYLFFKALCTSLTIR